MKEKKLRHTYLITSRFIVKSSVILIGENILIKPNYAFVKQVRLMKASLPTQAVRNLIRLGKGITEIVININNITEVSGRWIRKEREDISDIFKDVEGNIYEVILRTNDSRLIRLLMPQVEYVRLKNYIEKRT